MHDKSIVVAVFSDGTVRVRELANPDGKRINVLDNSSCFVSNAKIGFASLSGSRLMIGIAYEVSDASRDGQTIWNFVQI